ncbi:TlpA disulfide reductase family protein [Piscinibacter sakaiensis]|uniref:TlpA disulfide reductase family protein n=1 Tax=Piscinibacter sakaiensis TaxID=1547922 RepID=UPI003AAF9360
MLTQRIPTRRRLLAALAATCLASVGPAALAAAAAKGEVVDLPALQLIDGKRLADWKGQPAVIVFWSTDCAFCKRHNARLDKLYRELQARGSKLRIVGIATDRDPQAVRRHVAEHDLRFPVALDGAALRARLTERAVVPMTVLIDGSGRLLLAIPGEMTEDDIAAIGAQLG